jgi:AraC-like DNA-binding protein/ligand-binding sensor protein
MTNIIKRRETGPLLVKARQVVRSYEAASGCEVLILDQNDEPVENPAGDGGFSFCAVCRQVRRDAGPEAGELPCVPLHREGIAEARRRGSAYVYMCEAGFIYWISPIYYNGRYAGSLLGGGVLALDRGQAAEKLRALSGEKVSGEAARNYLADIPVKNHDEVKALARLLRVCGEQISDNTEDYGESVKRIVRQESALKTQIRLVKGRSFREPEPAYPLDKERALLAALRRGDNETGRKILGELLDVVLAANPGNFEFIRLRAVELVVLLSRAAVTPDISEDNAVLASSGRYLKRIQDSKNIEDLTKSLHLIIERLAGQLFSFKGVRHASALRKAERYIWENYTRKISLQEVADVSGLSAPYFSTIFKDEMGENFSTYINRLRVGKAASMMMETGRALNEIAAACGFEDQSWFSKIFKSYTGLSPGKYRDKGSGGGEFTAELGGPHAAVNS